MLTPERHWLETWRKAGPVLERIRQAELQSLPESLPQAFCTTPDNPCLTDAAWLRQHLLPIQLRQFPPNLTPACT